MSLERIIKALMKLGLSKLDAEVYVHLANHNSQKAMILAKALKFTRPKIYASLRNLTKKGLVTKKGLIFSALPFEEVLDMLITKEKELTDALQESEKEFLVRLKKE